MHLFRVAVPLRAGKGSCPISNPSSEHRNPLTQKQLYRPHEYQTCLGRLRRGLDRLRLVLALRSVEVR